ncbi:ABC transporter ATP-binding protein [Pararhodospirillum oryzae]|uniref:Spermidine/putrescine import ATP-binding protein PotA n=1 Tax=Pararhodospirillum oryzae TaxID=478448 RepID=A0A512H729_9PROT|nr:ABC transporter ATP-binding protein [Pararhodospirillum oryzae]GEO81244.1 polyamine-transporting ATPase [Pararhodospirillum oryzae]
MGEDILVAFRGVQKTYDGDTLVVKDLNLDIRRGEFLTLLGPSGSGKTTSLMMLAGFEVPTQGEILLDGVSLHNMPPHQRDIGMVFQNYALFPHMSILENVMFPLRVRKVPRAQARARALDALAMVRLEGLDARRPAQLSGGQQQRVALARALVFQPQLVLMDEPLGALDKQLREHMQMEIKHLHARLGVTVAYVTHDQTEALTMSDRIAVFNDGIIQQLDSPRGLYENPRNSFVAHFIGENNVLHGHVESQDGERALVRLEDGQCLRARCPRATLRGSRTSVSIRPERLHLEEIGSDVNALPGMVEEVIYHGDHVRLRARVAGNEDFTIKLRYRVSRPIPEPGDAITVSVAVEDCLALDPIG